MHAVVATQAGGPEVLSVAEVPDPMPAPGEVVVDVVAAGLNRADLLQRQGFYPPPPGASDIIGMECSGTIGAVGEGVEDWRVGDRVCALLAGGGYAERVAVPAGQLLPVPDGVELIDAAALPEVACTVWSNVFMVGGLRPAETLLAHGGAGGIGSFAIQLAHALGIRVLTTAGTPEKLELCRRLGADEAIDYHGDWPAAVQNLTDGAGVDVILDNMGASYLADNIDSLALEGRLVVIGMQGGRRGEIDLNALLRKRAALIATNLRGRPVAGKSAICAAVREHVWPLIADGSITTVVHQVFPLGAAADAHRLMESGTHTGKILLTVE
ncbi:MAG: NAD(P)H-quinone oxidoreductase [Nocardioides sp.]|uniref:NAD(P)H-quinone oxidoreductase n=1 Tax=Nocardioides sp. TaxID=35761 RepID=UPI0039E2D91F